MTDGFPLKRSEYKIYKRNHREKNWTPVKKNKVEKKRKNNDLKRWEGQLVLKIHVFFFAFWKVVAREEKKTSGGSWWNVCVSVPEGSSSSTLLYIGWAF